MASTLTVDNIQGATASTKVAIPGHVINVQSVNFTGDQNSSSGSFVDITNLSITMTPSSATSKFLLSCVIDAGGSQHFNFMRFVRNGTQIVQNDTIGNRTTGHFSFTTTNNGSSNYVKLPIHSQVLDSPNTTSNVTYKVQFSSRSDMGTAYINRSTRNQDASGGYDNRGISTFTVLEIAQ